MQSGTGNGKGGFQFFPRSYTDMPCCLYPCLYKGFFHFPFIRGCLCRNGFWPGKPHSFTHSPYSRYSCIKATGGDPLDLCASCLCQHCLWINPIDAEPRGIENGDTLLVFNDRGSVQITARVTARIMPGVVGMPHAHRREMVNGVDVGANANTLTSHHWSPISKNCPSTGSTLVQVKKA